MASNVHDSNANTLKQQQAQVEEVVGIMRTNVEKVLERDQKFTELGDRASALQSGASQFEQSSRKLKKKFWWQNMRMNIIIGIVVVLFLVIIIWSESS